MIAASQRIPQGDIAEIVFALGIDGPVALPSLAATPAAVHRAVLADDAQQIAEVRT